MTEHTPGPWFLHDFTGAVVGHNPSPGDITVSCDHPAELTVCTMGGGVTGTIDEAVANARLIAAAPMLFAALADLVPRFERACRHAGSDDEFIVEATRMHHAALRAARGEPESER